MNVNNDYKTPYWYVVKTTIFFGRRKNNKVYIYKETYQLVANLFVQQFIIIHRQKTNNDKFSSLYAIVQCSAVEL